MFMILKKIKLLFKTEDSFADTKDVFQSKLFNRHIYFVQWFDYRGRARRIYCQNRRTARLVKKSHKRYHAEIIEIVLDRGYVLRERIVY